MFYCFFFLYPFVVIRYVHFEWVSSILHLCLSKLPTRFKFKGKFYQQKIVNKKQNNKWKSRNSSWLSVCSVWGGCLCVCVSNEMISWEWVDENMKNIKVRGNKKEMLLFVDQNTKRIFFFFFFRLFGTGKGNVAPRVQSPPERKRYPPGWKVDAWVGLRECLRRCVDEMKVSLLVNIMT